MSCSINKQKQHLIADIITSNWRYQNEIVK